MTFKIRIPKIKTLQFLCIYISMQYYGGRIYTLLGSAIFFSLSLILSAFVLVYEGNLLFHSEKKINGYIFGVTAMAVWLALSIFYTMGNMTVGTSLSVLSRFLLIYVSVGLDPENFLTRFIKMTVLFAFVSDVVYFSHFVGFTPLWKGISKVFYRIPSGMYFGGDTYGLFFLVFKVDDLARNSYMFGEPGEYQMIINTCLYFLLFEGKSVQLTPKYKTVSICLLLVTLVTIQSTSGFISLVIIIGMSLLQPNRFRENQSVKKVIVVCICAVLLYVLIFADETSIFYQSFYRKVFSSDGQLDLQQGTAAARSMPYYLMAENLLQNPLQVIFGVGANGLAQTVVGRYTANGLVNFIMMCGLIFVVPLYLLMSAGHFQYGKNPVATCCVILICLNQSVGQPDMLSIYSVLLLLYPYIFQITHNRKNELCYE